MRGQRFFRKSDNPLISRFSLAAALACLTLLLSACPNPVSTNDPQSAAVLSVVGTVPSNGATGFDPGQTILVSFSKDLDPSCLTDIQSPVVISPSTLKAGSSITLTFSYDSPNKKLSIEPHPYLESNATYTVSFDTNLKDASGETLSKQVDFSFATGNNPAGDIQINAGAIYVTTTDNVTLSVQHNAKAASVRFANSAADLLSAPTYAVTTPPPLWTLVPSGDGTRTVFVQFFDSSNNPSTVRSASIVRDTVAPTIDSTTVPAYYNMHNDASNPPLRLAASASDATSGVAHYIWSGAGVTFNTASPYSEQSPAITISGKDGPYTVSLTVTDGAGLTTTIPQPIAIIKDTTPPDPPIVGIGNVPTMIPDLPAAWLYSQGIKWCWTASNSTNPYSSPDTIQASLNGTVIAPTSSTPPNYTYAPQAVGGDGTYTLTVEQTDAAGNVSAPLTLPVVVTPVIPYDRCTNAAQNFNFQFRDFTSGLAQQCVVHYWPHNDPVPGDRINLAFPWLTPNRLTRGATYDWFIELSLSDGTSYRSPADASKYYQFTVQ